MRAGRELSVASYQLAVPINFVGIVDWRYQQGVCRICGRSDKEVTAIPGKSCIAGWSWLPQDSDAVIGSQVESSSVGEAQRGSSPV